MKKVDNLLESALELAKILQTEEDSGKIDKKVKSDISSFGTAIQQCGLIPAVAMFSNTNSESGKRNVKMLNLIYALLYGGIEGKTDEQLKSQPLLLQVVLNRENKTMSNTMRYETMQACIALKLAVRTFKLEEVADAQS
ncbi:MAG: type III-B CRISPR module-associated protein Cmr5 [Bacteroidota bacterium]